MIDFGLYAEFDKAIMYFMDKGFHKFAVCPFGSNGLFLKYILNERYGIQDVLLIDNYFGKYNKKVIKIADLKEEHVKDRGFIASSGNSQILTGLKNAIPINQLCIPGFDIDNNKFSYGPISDVGGLYQHEVESMGKFCSIAVGACVVPNHPLNYVSTHEFMYSSAHFPQIKIDNRGVKWTDINPQKTKIGNDVWIGRNVIILNGASIGNGAIIGGGAVVTKDIPDYAVVVGNPARIIRYRFTQEQIDQLNAIQWWNWPLEKIEACYEDFKDIDIFIGKHYHQAL